MGGQRESDRESARGFARTHHCHQTKHRGESRSEAIFIWLSGASRKILAECPTERAKYFGIGAEVLITGSMESISLTFALVNVLKVSLRHAIIFAVLSGLAIMMIDRLFVASMHRQRNPSIYIIQALPRLLMSVVLGLVISTPFVLQDGRRHLQTFCQRTLLLYA